MGGYLPTITLLHNWLLYVTPVERQLPTALGFPQLDTWPIHFGPEAGKKSASASSESQARHLPRTQTSGEN